MGYFVTRGKIDQETLEKLTGFSRSTISRNISRMLEDGQIMVNKREFRKSVIYLLNSTSISIGNAILVVDEQIFSWTPKFEALIHELWTKLNFRKIRKILVSYLRELLNY